MCTDASRLGGTTAYDLPVSQFTLLGNCKKGNKPDFHGAADVEKARELYEHFHQKVRELYVPEKVKNGVFQAMMEVGLVNDGPVGVDYCSNDAAVQPRTLSLTPAQRLLLSTADALNCRLHLRYRQTRRNRIRTAQRAAALATRRRRIRRSPKGAASGTNSNYLRLY